MKSVELETQKKNIKMKNTTELVRECFEEDTLLEVLPTRSSTPCTGFMSYNTAQYDLNSIQHISPVEKSTHDTKINHILNNMDYSAKRNNFESSCGLKGFWNIPNEKKIKKIVRYSKSYLHEIRTQMISNRNGSYPTEPNIVYCDDVELEARLRQMNILSIKNGNLFTVKGIKYKKNSKLYSFPFQVGNESPIETYVTQKKKKKENMAQIEYCDYKLKNASPDNPLSIETFKKCTPLTSKQEVLTVDKLEAKWKNNSWSEIAENRNSSSNHINQNKCFSSFSKNIRDFINELQTHEERKQQILRLQQEQQQATLVANLHLHSVLKREESQLILKKLLIGEISKYGLLIQLGNPNLTQHHRESITAVLTVTSDTKPLQMTYNIPFLNLIKKIPFINVNGLRSYSNH